jgi:branched-subunit amino acid ABC-type transport system permease component
LNLSILALGFGLVTASILAIAAVGFTLQFAVTNILNIAYGDIMTASAFIAYLANSQGINIWVCLVIGGVFGCVASVLINRLIYVPFLRQGTPLFGMVIVSLAVGLIIQNVLLAANGATYFSYSFSTGDSLAFGGIILTVSQIAIIALAILLMVGVHLLLTQTRLGKAMRATASNPELARNCGIRTNRTVDIAWALSGALCGIAGVVLVMNTISFAATTGSSFLVVIIAAAILGGVGQPYGAMLGALSIGLISELSASIWSPDYKNVIAFVILVTVLLFRPQGLLSMPRTTQAAG